MNAARSTVDSPESMPDIQPPYARVLKFWIEYRKQTSPVQSPTIREACKTLRRSPSTIDHVLARLQDLKLMRSTAFGERRSWRPTSLGYELYQIQRGWEWTY